MNISLFGKIFAAIGVLVLLLGIIPVVTNLEKSISIDELTKARARMTIIGKPKPVTQNDYKRYLRNMRVSRKQQLGCIFKIGYQYCPMGGYSALFTYLGLLIVLVGGGLVIAARKPDTS